MQLESFRTRSRRAVIGLASGVALDRLAVDLNSWLARNRGLTPVRVVVMHGTPRRHAASLKAQLAWVAEHFKLLSPAELFGLLDDPSSAPHEQSVVLSFDDGLRTNYAVAAPLVEDLGTRALFFVNPAFCSAPPASFPSYYASKVRAGTVTAADLRGEDCQPMSPDDIRDLHRRGHAIANHTLSHAPLDRLAPEAVSTEISEGKRLIEEWTAARCRAFGWTFSWDAISPDAHALARRYHDYCFAACPGTNLLQSSDPALIWRINVEPFFPPAEARFLYAGLGNPFWKRRRRALEEIARESRELR